MSTARAGEAVKGPAPVLGQLAHYSPWETITAWMGTAVSHPPPRLGARALLFVYRKKPFVVTVYSSSKIVSCSREVPRI